jgi:hypothetical protein
MLLAVICFQTIMALKKRGKKKTENSELPREVTSSLLAHFRLFQEDVSIFFLT